MTEELKGAIEVLKKSRERDTMLKRKYHPNAGEKWYKERSVEEEAIDTVVQELERTIPTLKQSDDKRLLFSAYLQGKRDQIYMSTKWEELTPIGKYRIIKQFLAWHQTLKLKEETK